MSPLVFPYESCLQGHDIKTGSLHVKQLSKNGYKNVLDKIKQKTLVYGDKTLMAEFKLEKGANLPQHSYPHEQTGYLVSGQMAFTIDNVSPHAKSGDRWCIPGGVEHHAKVIEDSVAIEVFSPVREEYLPC